MKATVPFRHPTKGKIEVPLGFSWPAFFLGPIWAIAKRLWLVCSALILAGLPITFLDMYADDRKNIALTCLTLVLTLVYMYVCGKFGNAWWRWTIGRHGFMQEATHEP